MIEYTQAELDQLVSCPKVIVDPPKKAMTSVQGSGRNDMFVESKDGKRFRVFMRQSEKFEEDFSIGLCYEPKEGSAIILLRCNGIHGDVQGAGYTLHNVYHIHRAKVENIEQGFKPERGGEETDAYASYKQALLHFLRTTCIEWKEADFPGLTQLSLFSDDNSIDDN